MVSIIDGFWNLIFLRYLEIVLLWWWLVLFYFILKRYFPPCLLLDHWLGIKLDTFQDYMLRNLFYNLKGFLFLDFYDSEIG